MTCAPAGQTTPEPTSTQSEPFTFAATDQYSAGARHIAALWAMPMRAMMVVMSEAVGGHRR
ncbi:MAG: hypothetical protein AAFT19_07695 [Pseudomonadota bacterium]